MKRNVIVIGGGASGLIAAIFAAINGASVTVLEQNDKFGKKLLCTGNGKCNLTNLNYPKGVYRGSHPTFATRVLENFSPAETLKFFTDIGVYTKNINGYLYPNSLQASSVLELLIMKARSLKIKLKANERVTKILKSDNEFCVFTDTWEYKGSHLIIAAGSKASQISGSTDMGYSFAKTFGHSIIKPLPALVPVKGKGNYFSTWAGVRSNALVTLLVNDKQIKEEYGEVQFTDYGLSGIPIFQLSRYIARLIHEGCKVELNLDFMPDFILEECINFFLTRQNLCPYKEVSHLLTGLLPKKLHGILYKKGDTIENLAYSIKNHRVVVDKTLSLQYAQISSGGISTEELKESTLESKLCEHLYFVGEVVDIDGACGGYNLQWAWSSGALAGIACGIGETSDTD